MLLRTAYLCLSVWLTITLNAQPGPQPVRVTDMLEIKAIGSVAVSPDGRRVAYTVTSIVTDEKNAGEHRYLSQIWIAQTTGSLPQQQFTTSTDGAGQPVWSPDGSRLAFVRAVEGTPQIFVASLSGGEPQQITRMKTGASNPVWSPDGRRIAFTSSFNLRQYANDSVFNTARDLPEFGMEKPGLPNDFLRNPTGKGSPDGSLADVRAYLYQNEQDRKAKVIHQLNFQQEAVTSSEMNVGQVFLVEAVGGATPQAITRGFGNYGNPQFIPGTGLLLVEGRAFADKHPDRSLERALYTIDTLGRQLTRLIADSGYSYGQASVSNNGKWIALQKGRVQFNTIPELLLMPADGKGQPVTIPYDRNKSNLTWSADDKFIYFTSPSNGAVILNRLDVASRQVTRLTNWEQGIAAFDIRGGTLAYVLTEVASPYELYVADAQARSARVVTRLNSSWIRDRKISQPEKHSFRNELGQEVEYWVMKPVDFEPGKKYPLLLEIHGGPSAMWGPGESSMWHEYQYFCGKGYGVVYANPRGSGGYGETFLRANVNDWGNGPMRDVLGALDRTVAEGWADTSKLLITGGSYAGYLTAYILGHDRRFAAACAQRGVYDLRTFFGEGNAWRLVPNYFGGYPWQPDVLKVLERESPINYVDRIVTPLIIFHGEQDLRTGVIQSEQLYKSLKVLGRPVEYVRHPGATHEITRSGNNRQRIDQMLRTWEFFERFIGPKP